MSGFQDKDICEVEYCDLNISKNLEEQLDNIIKENFSGINLSPEKYYVSITSFNEFFNTIKNEAMFWEEKFESFRSHRHYGRTSFWEPYAVEEGIIYVCSYSFPGVLREIIFRLERETKDERKIAEVERQVAYIKEHKYYSSYNQAAFFFSNAKVIRNAFRYFDNPIEQDVYLRMRLDESFKIGNKIDKYLLDGMIDSRIDGFYSVEGVKLLEDEAKSRLQSIRERQTDFDSNLNEFSKSISDSYEEYYGNIRAKYDKFCSNVLDKYDSYNGKITVKHDQFSNDLDLKKNEFYNRVDNRYSQLYREANDKYDEYCEKLKEHEAVYKEKLRLLKPCEYWDNFRKRYRTEGIVWAVISLVLTAVIVAITFLLIYKMPDKLFIGNKLIIEHTIKWSILLALIFSALFYLMRLAVRLCLSAFHLSRDANERMQLTHQYLSLTNEGVLDETSREILLQSLFSRADTGLLKGDSHPSFPDGMVSQVLKNILK